MNSALTFSSPHFYPVQVWGAKGLTEDTPLSAMYSLRPSSYLLSLTLIVEVAIPTHLSTNIRAIKSTDSSDTDVALSHCLQDLPSVSAGIDRLELLVFMMALTKFMWIL